MPSIPLTFWHENISLPFFLASRPTRLPPLNQYPRRLVLLIRLIIFARAGREPLMPAEMLLDFRVLPASVPTWITAEFARLSIDAECHALSPALTWSPPAPRSLNFTRGFYLKPG